MISKNKDYDRIWAMFNEFNGSKKTSRRPFLGRRRKEQLVPLPHPNPVLLWDTGQHDTDSSFTCLRMVETWNSSGTSCSVAPRRSNGIYQFE